MRTPPTPATPAGNRSAGPAGASTPLPVRNRFAAGTGTTRERTARAWAEARVGD